MDTEYFKHIEPRDAFSGGRTEAFKLYYKLEESKGKEINYIDITSLYHSSILTLKTILEFPRPSILFTA